MHFLNQIFPIDNLELLRQLPDACLDLIYIDPPFFSQVNYTDTSGSFSDKWDSLESYLAFMKERLVEIHRVLKSTGSFYLHCDYHTDSYLRVICDELFGYKNLVNVLIWLRVHTNKGTLAEARKYGNSTDTIFLYVKSEDYYFKLPKLALTDKQIARDYKYIEQSTGRKFTHVKLNKTRGTKDLYFHDQGHDCILHDDIGWRWTQETYESRIRANPLCLYWGNSGIPRMKLYLDEHQGVALNNVWNDISCVQGSSVENEDYPTQKPEALLERIITASSKEGDIVGDFFCGSGTTLAVAKKLHRKYVGCDKNEDAVTTTIKRLQSIIVFRDLQQMFNI